MSLARVIFGHFWSSLMRKARGTEEFGRNVLENWRTLRRTLFYFGSIYSSGQLIRHYFIDWGSSAGPSMFPTMPEETQYIFINRRNRYESTLKPGDIINFTSPIFHEQPNGKRLIGLPGDYVVLDAHMAPSVGNAPVPGITGSRNQDKIEKGAEIEDRKEPMMIEIPEGHTYVVGDNMSWSRDSRFFGPLPLALVDGKQFLHGGFGQGWQWTVQNQMRRIPKEDEEEYLRGWKQKQFEKQVVATQEIPVQASEKVD